MYTICYNLVKRTSCQQDVRFLLEIYRQLNEIWNKSRFDWQQQICRRWSSACSELFDNSSSLKASLFEQVGTALMISSDLLLAVITDLLFPVFNRIDQGRLISLLQACTRQYATGLFQQVCYSLTKWTGLLLYVNSLRQLGKINNLQQVCDISGRVRGSQCHHVL